MTLPHKFVELSNGLRLYMVKYPSPGLIAYHIPVRVGSRDETEKGKTGFAHFFEHLMFRGTKNILGNHFRDRYSTLGASDSAYTSDDLTGYHGEVATKNFPKILELEADRFQNLSFPEPPFKDEAGAVLGEYNKNAARPSFMMEELILDTAFLMHPYKHSTMGYKEDIYNYKNMYKDAWNFFQQYYRPENVSIVVVGDVDFKKIEKDVKRLFGNWNPSPKEKNKIPEEPEQKEPRTAEKKIDAPIQTQINIAYKIPAFSTKEKVAASLTIAADIFLSEVSEFQKKYLFEKQWIDQVSAPYFDHKDPFIWQIQLQVTSAGNAHREEIISAVTSIFEKLDLKSIPSDLFEAAKKRQQNEVVLHWFTSAEVLAMQIAHYTSFEKDFGVLDRLVNNIKELKKEDIVEISKKYLKPSGRTIVQLRGQS